MKQDTFKWDYRIWIFIGFARVYREMWRLMVLVLEMLHDLSMVYIGVIGFVLQSLGLG